MLWFVAILIPLGDSRRSVSVGERQMAIYPQPHRLSGMAAASHRPSQPNARVAVPAARTRFDSAIMIISRLVARAYWSHIERNGEPRAVTRHGSPKLPMALAVAVRNETRSSAEASQVNSQLPLAEVDGIGRGPLLQLFRKQFFDLLHLGTDHEATIALVRIIVVVVLMRSLGGVKCCGRRDFGYHRFPE